MPHAVLNPAGLHDPVPFGYSHTASIAPGTELVLVAGPVWIEHGRRGGLSRVRRAGAACVPQPGCRPCRPRARPQPCRPAPDVCREPRLRQARGGRGGRAQRLGCQPSHANRDRGCQSGDARNTVRGRSRRRSAMTYDRVGRHRLLEEKEHPQHRWHRHTLGALPGGLRLDWVRSDLPQCGPRRGRSPAPKPARSCARCWPEHPRLVIVAAAAALDGVFGFHLHRGRNEYFGPGMPPSGLSVRSGPRGGLLSPVDLTRGGAEWCRQ